MESHLVIIAIATAVAVATFPFALGWQLLNGS